MQRGGYSAFQAQQMAVGLLNEAAMRQAATLAYADVFRCMAIIGVLALCLVPLMSPATVVKK